MRPNTLKTKIDTSTLYRMPWTISDNGFTWLEPTRKCNMSCEYCYQRNDVNSQKSLREIETELECMMKLRKCDTMIIAGAAINFKYECLYLFQTIRKLLRNKCETFTITQLPDFT